MQVQGNTSGSIKSVALGIAGTLTAFTLYNKTGGAIACSVGLVISDTDRYMFNYSLAATGSNGSSVYEETKITVTAGTKVLLISSGSCDYFFQID